MTVPLKIIKGQVFRRVETGALLSFRELGPKNTLVFSILDSKRTERLSHSELEDLMAREKMVRVSSSDPETDARKERVIQLAAANTDGNCNERLKSQVTKAVRAVRNAEILDFYIRRWIEHPEVRASRRAVEKFVRSLRHEARRLSFEWEPSYSAIYRARSKLEKFGAGTKTFLRSYGEHDPAKRHLPLTERLRQRMIEEYYSSPSVRPGDVIASFYDDFHKELDSRGSQGLSKQKPPAPATLRRWIKKAGDRDNLTKKYGIRAANRATRGHNFAMRAVGALEIVMIDHTLTDVWVKVFDEDGNEIGVARPWLIVAVDVFSSMVLGGVLTLEPPSLLSVMLCLKQVVRRKDFLIERYGFHKGATDGYGLPSIIVVDNGWENVGSSFQSACTAARIHVEWAPVRTPEYKPYVERVFGSLNTGIWHKLAGGIPYRASDVRKTIRPDSRTEAIYTLDQLNDLFWDFVVTVRHVETRDDGYREAPAMAWSKSLKKLGRDVPDNLSVLDSFFGTIGSATLTAAGITFQKHRFHDQEAVSQMLDAMLRFEPVRNQRSSQLSTGKVRVSFTRNAEDCSYIDVWDYARKQNVRLPNCDPRFSNGLDWKHAERIQLHAREQNLAFHTDQEKYTARAAFNERVKRTAADAPFRESKKAVRAYHSEVRVVPGTEVRIDYASPSISGLEGMNIPRSLAGSSIESDRIPTKGRKAVKKKQRQKALAPVSREAPLKKHKGPTASLDQYELAKSTAPQTGGFVSGPDAEAMMARFAAELDGEGDT